MSDKFVLVVSDEKDEKYGEVSVLDTAHETELLVETLLEAGIDQKRIRVLAGSEAEFATTYRPVVALTDEANQRTEPDGPASDQAEPVEAHSGKGRSRGRARPSSLLRSARNDDATDVYISASEAAS